MNKTYSGLAALTHGDFTPVGAQDYSDCLALMPAQVSIYATSVCLIYVSLCGGPAQDRYLLTFQHDFVKLPGSSCQKLMVFFLKDNQHQKILVWKGYQVTYPSPIAFQQNEMLLTPTLADVCLSNLFLKPPVQGGS